MKYQKREMVDAVQYNGDPQPIIDLVKAKGISITSTSHPMLWMMMRGAESVKGMWAVFDRDKAQVMDNGDFCLEYKAS